MFRTELEFTGSLLYDLKLGDVSVLEVESAVSRLVEASELTVQPQIHVYTEILLVKRNLEVILPFGTVLGVLWCSAFVF